MNATLTYGNGCAGNLLVRVCGVEALVVVSFDDFLFVALAFSEIQGQRSISFCLNVYDLIRWDLTRQGHGVR
jgi:hypothetical protein